MLYTPGSNLKVTAKGIKFKKFPTHVPRNEDLSKMGASPGLVAVSQILNGHKRRR